MLPSNSSFKPNHRFDRNRKPTPSTSRFTKLMQQERDNLTKKGACFWCRKRGHMLKDCPYRKRKISTAAGTLDEERPSEIKTAAQSCWNMHSAPVSCLISLAYTINSLVVSSICGIYYCYLCYLLRYLGLFLFLFVYKDIYSTSCSHASVHTLVSICHTVLYKSDMRLAFLFMDFSTLLPITVSLFYYAVQPLSLVFSDWHLALS